MKKIGKKIKREQKDSIGTLGQHQKGKGQIKKPLSKHTKSKKKISFNSAIARERRELNRDKAISR